MIQSILSQTYLNKNLQCLAQCCHPVRYPLYCEQNAQLQLRSQKLMIIECALCKCGESICNEPDDY